MENVGMHDSASAASRTWHARRGATTPEPPASSSRLREALLVIDALGRKCPIPIIMLAEQVRDVPIGSVVAVLADDPAAYTDIPSWCQMKSHDLAFREPHQSGWSFGIKRNY
jgi:tRNA 2-thiouridine synthesizing protein A